MTSALIEQVVEMVTANTKGEQIPQLCASFHVAPGATVFDPDSWGGGGPRNEPLRCSTIEE